VKQAGLPDMRFHDLRHTCATFLIAEGIHPRVVMEILGHANIVTTMNIYGHVLPEIQREAAQRLENLLGGAV
jgi:integrase